MTVIIVFNIIHLQSYIRCQAVYYTYFERQQQLPT